MNAIQTRDQYPIEVVAEARRIAVGGGAQYEDLPRIEASVAYDLFRRAIEPLTAQKVKIVGMSEPKVIFVVGDGSSLHHIAPALSEGQIEALRLLDELIAAEADRYGLSAP